MFLPTKKNKNNAKRSGQRRNKQRPVNEDHARRCGPRERTQRTMLLPSLRSEPVGGCSSDDKTLRKICLTKNFNLYPDSSPKSEF